MVPEKPSNETQFDLFRLQLDNIINRNHETLPPGQDDRLVGVRRRLRIPVLPE